MFRAQHADNTTDVSLGLLERWWRAEGNGSVTYRLDHIVVKFNVEQIENVSPHGETITLRRDDMEGPEKDRWGGECGTIFGT